MWSCKGRGRTMNGFLQCTGFAVDHSLCIKPCVDSTPRPQYRCIRIMCNRRPKICIKHQIIAIRVSGFTWCFIKPGPKHCKKALPSFQADVFRACWESSALLPFRDKDWSCRPEMTLSVWGNIYQGLRVNHHLTFFLRSNPFCQDINSTLKLLTLSEPAVGQSVQSRIITAEVTVLWTLGTKFPKIPTVKCLFLVPTDDIFRLFTEPPKKFNFLSTQKRQKTLLNIHTGDAGAGDDLAFSLEEIL